MIKIIKQKICKHKDLKLVKTIRKTKLGDSYIEEENLYQCIKCGLQMSKKNIFKENC